MESAPPPWTTVPSPDLVGGSVAAIKSRGYLTVGVDQTTLDWGYYDAAKQRFTGFDVDTLVKVATAIFGGDPVSQGKIQFKVVPNADRQKAVDDGTVDLVAETMTITCKRKQDPDTPDGPPAVEFSSVYFLTGQGILVAQGSPITKRDDLDGKRVCATKGSTSIDQLRALADQGIHVEPWQAATQTDCLVMLQQGDVDAVSTDNTILAGLAKQDPSLVVLKDATTGSPISLQDEPYGIAIAKGRTDLVQFVNAVLAQDRTDPSDQGWKARYRRWLCPSDPCAVPEPPPAAYTS